MMTFKKYSQLKRPGFLKPRKFIGYLCLLFLFTTCKKEITKEEPSLSSLKYIDGGIKDKINTIEKTRDGGFIYCGYTGADSGRVNALLIKVDAKGDREWYKTFGGVNYDAFYHVIQTSDGGYLAVGATNSIGKGLSDKDHFAYDYVVKINENGHEEWSHSYNTNPGQLFDCIETPDHSFYVSGYILLNNLSPARINLIKIDADGKQVFLRYYTNLESLPPNLVSKSYHAYGLNLSLASDGSVIIGGIMSKSNSIVDEGKVSFLMKINSNGIATNFYPYYEYVSGQRYLSSSTSYNNTYKFPFLKVLPLLDGYLTATFTEGFTDQILRIQLIKTDFSGNVIWHKEYSGLGNSLLFNIEPLNEGSFLLVGASSKDMLTYTYFEAFSNLQNMIMKVDKDGNEIWTKYPGNGSNSNITKCAQPLPDGSWNLAGYTSVNATGFIKMFWYKTDKEGFFLK